MGFSCAPHRSRRLELHHPDPWGSLILPIPPALARDILDGYLTQLLRHLYRL